MRCIFKKRPDCGETCIAASDAVASAFLISLEALIYKEKCRNGETERSVAICTRRQQSFFTEPSVDRRSKRSEEHTSELQSLMRISYAVFCLKKKKTNKHILYVISNIKPTTVTIVDTNQYHIIQIY